MAVLALVLRVAVMVPIQDLSSFILRTFGVGYEKDDIRELLEENSDY